MRSPGLLREPAFVGDGATPFFAWLHRDSEAPARDLVAIICPPIGSEYTRSHRSLRHLADRLAHAGVAALRIDYHGTGDSPGSDLDPDRVATWIANIADAARIARARTGCTRVALVGVRLGATLAAVASREVDAALLVLWNAPVRGNQYVRELQAIAMTAARVPDSEGALEAAGFAMTAQTVEALRAIDLTQAPLRAQRVLLVARDDLKRDATLPAHLDALGIAHDTLALPGWTGMMAEHQDTIVPDAALDAIVGWVASHATPLEAPPEATPLGSLLSRIPFTDAAHEVPAMVEETACHFGEDGRLFGVLSRIDASTTRPAIVMFNGGAVHHVGPNRLYVMLARSLAAMGFPCLRFDLEGIGDSVLRGPGRENHPYPAHATANAQAALAFLRERFGYRHFIALGLCSGAHTAFHSALRLESEDIPEVVLINPTAFYWQEGMSLDVVTKIVDARTYTRSMRDPRRWMKLARGDVNVRRVLAVTAWMPLRMARTWLHRFFEIAAPHLASPLARDLRRLFLSNRKVTVLLSEGEPGGEIIMAEASRTARRALRAGHMHLETIAGGDHTFTRSQTRGALIARVGEHLKPWISRRHPA